MTDNCTAHRLLFYIQGCMTDEELAGIMLGVFSAALWTLVHISFYTHQRRNMKINRYVTSSITTHMVADGFSCIGAIMSQQKSLQVMFALCGTIVNAAIGLHCWCSRNANIENCGATSSNVHKKPVIERCHCLCSTFFLGVCLMFVTICVTQYITLTDDNIVYRASTKPYIHTVLTMGYVLGSFSTILYWLSKFYEIVESYKSSRHKNVNTCTYLIAITGDTTYLLGVYIQMSTVFYVIQTLPWTFARMGLIGIHIGIIVQRSWSSPKKKDNDKETLLKQNRKSDESDWSDDSSTVVCVPFDLQTSLKQMVCSESHNIEDIDKSVPDNVTGSLNELPTIEDDKRLQNAVNEGDTPIIMESASSGSPELEWDFEWLSDTKRRHLPRLNKLTSYNGYYKVVEWFQKSWDSEKVSDIEDDLDKKYKFDGS